MLLRPALISVLLALPCLSVVIRSNLAEFGASKLADKEALYVWSDGSGGGEEGLVRADAKTFGAPHQLLSMRKSQQLSSDDTEANHTVPTEEPLKLGATSAHGLSKKSAAKKDWGKQSAAKKGAANKSAANKSTSGHYKHVTSLVMPQSKFAFCYFPKVGSAQFTRLFDVVNGVDQAGGWRGEGMGHSNRSFPSTMRVSWKNVTHEEGWKFAFFTRDPLSRYLSAFGSKCMVNEFGAVEGQPPGVDCMGKVLWNPVPLEVAVATFEERVFNDSRKQWLAPNPHWWSMTKLLERCDNVKFDPSTIDFKGDFDGDVHAEVTKMLDMANVENASGLAERFFPQSQIRGHSSQTESRLKQFYRNPQVVQAVANLYAMDYVRLGLPLPEKGHPWIKTLRASEAKTTHWEAKATPG